MGRYANGLLKRLHQKEQDQAAILKRRSDPAIERLVGVGIEREGVIHGNGRFKSHWELRAAIGDPKPEDPKRGDIEGFITSMGRFLNRYVAISVAADAAQVPENWRGSNRKLLSSDVNW